MHDEVWGCAEIVPIVISDRPNVVERETGFVDNGIRNF